jgi:hypothetical protein
MRSKNIFRLGIFLLFFGVIVVGQVMAATESDFTRGFTSHIGLTDLTSHDKAAAISQLVENTDAKSSLISDIPGSSMADIAKYIQDQKQKPIEWDPAFMSRTSRYAHYVPSCRIA